MTRDEIAARIVIGMVSSPEIYGDLMGFALKKNSDISTVAATIAYDFALALEVERDRRNAHGNC